MEARGYCADCEEADQQNTQKCETEGVLTNSEQERTSSKRRRRRMQDWVKEGDEWLFT